MRSKYWQLNMEQEVAQLVAKIHKLEAKLERIKIWIWQKFEDTIPEDILDPEFEDNEEAVQATKLVKVEQIPNQNEQMVSLSDLNDHPQPDILPESPEPFFEAADDHFDDIESIPDPNLTSIEKSYIKNEFSKADLIRDCYKRRPIIILERLKSFTDIPSLPTRIPKKSKKRSKRKPKSTSRRAKKRKSRAKIPQTAIPIEELKGDFPCSKCPVVSKSNLIHNEHFAYWHTNLHPCSHCQIKFIRTEMNDHCLEAHPDQLKFTCIICQAKFFSKRQIQYHRKIVHQITGPGRHTMGKIEASCPHKCPDCSSEFILENNLIIHRVKVHGFQREEGKADLMCCEICGAMLSYSGLKKHETIHKNLSNFKCEIEGCGKVFTQKQNFAKHMKVVHVTAEEKKEERLMTSRIACAECGKLVSREYLPRHITLKHDTKRPRLTCGIGGCTRNFAFKYILWEHYRVHMNKRRPEYSEEFTRDCPEEVRKFLEGRRKATKKYATKYNARVREEKLKIRATIAEGPSEFVNL